MHSSLCLRSPNSGFTLIELIVTITVASVLIAIAVPSFSAMMINSRMTSQSYDLISSLHLARSEAVKRNGTVSLCRVRDANATACATSNADWVHWIVRANNGTIVRRGRVNTYNETIRVTSTLTSDRVDFGSDGLARSGGTLVADLAIGVCASKLDTNNVRRVVLGAGSRVSTEHATGSCS